MSKALYRKYRSKTLDEVIGQKHITDILARAIEQNHISHAYLFTGPRGVGKTSVARILAHEINKLPYNDELHLDIIEIDAASNNGVEDVRDLREKVQIAPVSANKKVYIIDEVHMLSKPAFNALLKTLEEPPSHVIFILATTNLEKIPATIISRTQRFSFRPINLKEIEDHLKNIAKKEKIKVDDEAISLIAKHGDGSFRDSISLLDQLSNVVPSGTKIDANIVVKSLGLAPSQLLDKILDLTNQGKTVELIKSLNQAFDDGVEASVLILQLVNQLSSQIIDDPNLLGLMDQLTSIIKTAQPKYKLIATLGLASIDNSSNKDNHKNLPTTASTLSFSTPVEAIIKPSKITKPKSNTDKPKQPSKSINEFKWPNFLSQVKQTCVPLHSILVKCSHKKDEHRLTIFAINNFYRNKLISSKYQTTINQALEQQGLTDVDIHIIPTPPPPSSSQAASVADIMGGAVEVEVDL